MENNEKYNPIEYRINKDLSSMKQKNKKSYHKVFYTLLIVIVIFCFILIGIKTSQLNYAKTELNNLKLKDSVNIHKIDSLNRINDSLNRINDSLQQNVIQFNNKLNE